MTESCRLTDGEIVILRVREGDVLGDFRGYHTL